MKGAGFLKCDVKFYRVLFVNEWAGKQLWELVVSNLLLIFHCNYFLHFIQYTLFYRCFRNMKTAKEREMSLGIFIRYSCIRKKAKRISIVAFAFIHRFFSQSNKKHSLHRFSFLVFRIEPPGLIPKSFAITIKQTN